MTETAIESAMTVQGIVSEPTKPEPITQMKLISKSSLKKMVKSHGFQLGSDFYHALNDRATTIVLQSLYRMIEKGWRVRVGVQDL